MKTWVVVPFSRPRQLDAVLQNFERQRSVEDRRLVLVCNGAALGADVAGEPRVTCLQHTDAHQSTARNAGIAFAERYGARGDVVALMDDDDYYAPRYLAEQVHFAKLYELVGKQPNLVLREDGLWLLQPELASCERNWVSSATMAWRLELEHRFEREATGEDIRLSLKVQAAGGRVYASSARNYVYVRTGSSHLFEGDPVDAVRSQGRPALRIAAGLDPEAVEDPHAFIS